MTTPPRTARRLAAGFALLLASAGPAFAADPSAAAPVFAGYWADFVQHWAGSLKQQNGVILFALGVGAVSLFIITRGKWKK